MASSSQLNGNVYPFILRGVNLLGVDSAQLPLAFREDLWQKFAHEWRLSKLNHIVDTIHLDAVLASLESLLRGDHVGRFVVDLSPESACSDFPK